MRLHVLLPPLVMGGLAACSGEPPVIIDQRFPPSCEVVWPAEEGTVLLGEAFELAVSISDSDTPPEELTVRAVSDLDGIFPGEPVIDDIGATLPVDGALLRDGYHTLTVTVSDETAVSDCSTTFFVVPNTDPSCNFASPDDGGTYLSSENLFVELSTFDAETTDLTELSIEWNGIGADQPTSSDSPDSDGNTGWFLPLLPAGNYSIGARVTDPVGGTRTCSVAFSIIPTDGDGDGWISAGDGGLDCDDAAFAVNPGQIELCNGIDDDCDGVIDEDDAFEAPGWYLDADGDNYGDPATLVVQCTQPSGYIASGGDCDDGDVSVRPGADELCNGVDDDCDGLVDDSPIDGFTYYADLDADTFGDLANPILACTPDGDVSFDGTDCDDSEAAVNPAATEVCGNGRDDDCDGGVDELCFIDHCGTISTPELWTSDATHRVTCPVHVESTLSILEGTEVEFTGDGRIEVGRNAPGRMYALGTAADPVVFAPAAGSFAGQLSFGTSDTGSELRHFSLVNPASGRTAIDSRAPYLVLEDCTLRDGTVDAVWVDTDSELAMSRCTVEGFLGQGVLIDGRVATLDANIVTNNIGAPLEVPADEVASIGLTNTLTGNWTDGVRVQAGWVNLDASWPLLDVPYLATGTIRVGGLTQPRLTLEPGVTVRFPPGATLRVGDERPGSLRIDAASDPVRLAPRALVPTPGAWNGLVVGGLDQGSSLDGLVIEYAEHGIAMPGSLDVSQPTLLVDNAVITGSESYGIEVLAFATLDLRNSTVQDGLATAVYVRGTLAEFTNNTLADNDGYGVSIRGDQFDIFDGTSTFTGNSPNEILLFDSPRITTDRTWHAAGAPFRTGYQEVAIDDSSHPNLTLGDGLVVHVTGASGIDVIDGSLDVEPGPQGVLLTSAAAAPFPGAWGDVNFTNGGTIGPLGLDGLTIEYAGNPLAGSGIRFARSDIDEIRGVTVRYSGGAGLSVGANADIARIDGCTFEDNEGPGLVTSQAGRFHQLTNTVSTGNERPMYLMHPLNADGIDASNTLSGNDIDRIYLRSFTAYNQVDRDLTFRRLDVDWHLGGQMYVGDPVTPPVLTFEPGVTFYVSNAGILLGYGGPAVLDIAGTPAQPVTFTSGEATPAPGDWHNITLAPDTSGTIAGAVVEYGGTDQWGSDRGLLHYNMASAVTLDEVRLENSSAWGIYGTNLGVSGRPDLSTVSFANNPLGDINW